MALGYRHLRGYGVPKSCDVAAKYYKQVAEQVIRELTEDDGQPAVVLEKYRLSDERHRIESPDRDPEVLQYYRQAATHGDTGAQMALGKLHFYGAQGVEHDPARAAQYFQAAADQGDPGAMSALAQLYVKGQGVEQDRQEAIRWYEQAAQRGDDKARRHLEALLGR